MSRLLLAVVAAASCLTPAIVVAQDDVLDAKSAALMLAEYRADLATVHAKLVDLANTIPADRYGWRPAPGARSVSEVLTHVAGEWYYICPISIGAKPPEGFSPPGPAMRKIEGVTAKADVLKELAASWEHCQAAFSAADASRLLGKYEPAKMSLARAALRVTGDQHEHLGQLIAYVRAIGLKPSWSNDAPSPAPAPAPSGAPATGQPRADSVPAHDAFTLQSKALGEARAINVYTPPKYRGAPAATAQRLPVLYMPDGGIDEDFVHVVRTVDSLIARGAIRPVLVVGVPNTQRRRDLTGPTRVASDSAIAPRVGGSAAFRRFLREELMPEIDRRYRTLPERTIIGESLAGLFIVETLLEEPALFTHYIALDPSLWWNAGALVDSARSRVPAAGAAPRTLYMASSVEPDIATGTARLAGLLRSAPAALRWKYEPHPELTHATIFRALKTAALVDALR